MTPIPVFASLSTQDKELWRRLKAHLSALQRDNYIKIWESDNIEPGQEWPLETEQALQTAKIALLLLSSDYLNDNYHEMQEILERYRKDEKRVILIRLRPCDWNSSLQKEYDVLPQGNKPVTLWNNWDEACRNIAQGIREIISPAPKDTIREAIPYQQESFFIGRQYIFDEVYSFIEEHSSGYIKILGEPGAGKTAILSQIVNQINCCYFFNNERSGRNRVDQFLRSIIDQLINKYEISSSVFQDSFSFTSDSQDIHYDANTFISILEYLSRNTVGNIVIAVDALDEAEWDKPTSNTLFLPSYFPDNVYFIISYRNKSNVNISIDVPSVELDLSTFQQGYQDIKSYINFRIEYSEQLYRAISDRSEDVDFFIEKIARKSQCNFMYIVHILTDIEQGEYQDITLEKFPEGLADYYTWHWKKMGMATVPLPMEKIKIIYTSAERKDKGSIEQIQDCTQETEPKVAIVIQEWRQFLKEEWREVDKQYVFWVYHSSFKNFLHHQDTLKMHSLTLSNVRKRIIDYNQQLLSQFINLDNNL